MDSSAIGRVVLTAEKKAVLNEGIGLIFSRWTALQAAVENHWAGRYSKEIADGIASTVFHYFIQSKGPLDFDGLAYILEAGLEELKTVADDGSLEEVTEKLLKLYKECRDGIFTIVEELRKTKPQTSARVVKVSNGNNEEDGESDDEDDESYDEDEEDTCMNCDQATDMMVDATEDCSNRKPEAMPVDEPAEDDGWTRPRGRKNKGKRGIKMV